MRSDTTLSLCLIYPRVRHQSVTLSHVCEYLYCIGMPEELAPPPSRSGGVGVPLLALIDSPVDNRPAANAIEVSQIGTGPSYEAWLSVFTACVFFILPGQSFGHASLGLVAFAAIHPKLYVSMRRIVGSTR